MRLCIGLLAFLALAACTDATGRPGQKYLFKTNAERCAEVAAEGTPEYADCEKRLAHQDAQRIYNMNNGTGSKPGWVVLRSP
ncbi:MAG TPA: hypothetical protein VH835_13800 [Dongiaceae bacterium]|jgi:hypothetical protein